MDTTPTTSPQPPTTHRHRRRRSAVALSLGLVFAAGAIAACGDDEPSSKAEAPVRLTRTELAAKGNSICEASNARVGKVIGALFEDPNPTPEAMDKALAVGVASARQTSAAFAKLNAPKDLTDELDALVTKLDSISDQVDQLTGDQFFASEDDPWAAANDLANTLGFTACTES